MTICSYVSVFFCHTLISLDASLRYPVTPNVSSRSRPAVLFVVGISFSMYSFYSHIYFPTSSFDENDATSWAPIL